MILFNLLADCLILMMALGCALFGLNFLTRSKRHAALVGLLGPARTHELLSEGTITRMHCISIGIMLWLTSIFLIGCSVRDIVAVSETCANKKHIGQALERAQLEA